MLRTEDPTGVPVVSEEEQAVLRLEERRTAAETALQSASEAKKRIEGDVDTLSKNAESLREVIEKNNAEIATTGNSVLEAQNSVRKESQNLDELIQKKKGIEKEIEDLSVSLTDSKARTAAEIAGLKKDHESAKASINKDIIDLEAKKTKLDDDIKTSENNLSNLKNTETSELAKHELKKKEYDALLATLEGLNTTISKLKGEVIDQETILGKKKLEVGQCDADILLKKDTIKQLDADISKKKQEYKALEASAFSIISKQQTLENREEFIRAKYDRAGIKWEEE